jgi:hypothetical protein
VTIGNCTFTNIESIININGENILSVKAIDNPSEFEPAVLFSGTFYNKKGELLFNIINNEWQSSYDVFDLKTTNGEIEVFESTTNCTFNIKKIPSENRLHITKLDMWIYPFRVLVKDKELVIRRYSKKENNYIELQVDMDFEYGRCGIYLDKNDLPEDIVFSGLYLHGGQYLKVRKKWNLGWKKMSKNEL